MFDLGGRTYVKRIVATAGETVWLLRQRDGSEPELLGPQGLAQVRRVLQHKRFKNVWRIEECAIPPRSIAPAGDNLGASEDSRSFGPIPTASLRAAGSS